jgi:predicted nucleic acid-binding protein
LDTLQKSASLGATQVWIILRPSMRGANEVRRRHKHNQQAHRRLIDTEDIPPDAELVATHVQVDELNKTRDEDRRARLFLRFVTTVGSIVPTESTVLDVSRLDYSKLGDGVLYARVKADLDSLNKGKPNNSQDALIAEVAIANGYTLLTADRDLSVVAQKHGCTVQHFAP